METLEPYLLQLNSFSLHPLTPSHPSCLLIPLALRGGGDTQTYPLHTLTSCAPKTIFHSHSCSHTCMCLAPSHLCALVIEVCIALSLSCALHTPYTLNFLMLLHPSCPRALTLSCSYTPLALAPSHLCALVIEICLTFSLSYAIAPVYLSHPLIPVVPLVP